MSDLSKCPKCGGVADNGHDRCYPPNPYLCTKCEGKMTNETMPEVAWISLYETVAECRPKGYWDGGRWPAVFKQNRDRSTKYIRHDIVENYYIPVEEAGVDRDAVEQRRRIEALEAENAELRETLKTISTGRNAAGEKVDFFQALAKQTLEKHKERG